MIWRSSDILGSSLRATDGPIGSTDDLLFEDDSWAIRWAVVHTGTWLPGRKVLLPPSCFARTAIEERELPVDLSRRQVKDSPGIASDAPVSRQMETDICGYYGWQPYWSVGHLPAFGAVGAAFPPMAGGKPGPGRPGDPEVRRSGDSNLRSINEVMGYAIAAIDDEIGEVQDFLVDREEWEVRYLLVDTGSWLPGKKVLVSPRSVREVSWSGERIRVDLSRAQVEASPEYDPEAAVERDYEARLHRHYGLAPYWI
jgi:hypothetical protein